MKNSILQSIPFKMSLLVLVMVMGGEIFADTTSNRSITRASGYYRLYDGGYYDFIGDKKPSIGFRYTNIPNNIIAVSKGKEVSDPGTIFYLTGTAGDFNDVTEDKAVLTKAVLASQGTDTKTVLGQTFSVVNAETVGKYKFVYRTSFFTIQLKNYNGPGIGRDKQDGYGYFDVQPVTEENIDKYYFGVAPSEQMKDDEGCYWTSLYTSFPYQCYEQDGVEAYVVTEVGNSYGEQVAVLAQIEDGKVPANTGVLLKCKGTAASGNRLIPIDEAVSGEVPAINGNLLKGTFQLKNADRDPDTYQSATMRVFSANADGEMGFYTLDDGTELKANKAYLDISSLSESAAKSIKLTFDGNTTTGIKTLDTTEAKQNFMNDNRIYDLQGRVVEHPTKGIYIKNGRKFIIR